MPTTVQLRPLVLLALMLIAATPPETEDIKVGDMIRLHASADGGIPIVDSEEDYRGFLASIRQGQYPMGYLKALTVPGRLVEVVALRDDRTYPLRAPAAVIRIAEGTEKGDLLWVARQYIRPREAKPPKGEVRLPDFVFVPDPKHAYERGDTTNLHADDRKEVPIGANREAFRVIAAALADEKGRPADIHGPDIFHLPIDTELQFLWIDPSRAAVCRVMDGPHAGDYAWVPQRFIQRYQIRMVYPKTSRKAKGRR